MTDATPKTDEAPDGVEKFKSALAVLIAKDPAATVDVIAMLTETELQALARMRAELAVHQARLDVLSAMSPIAQRMADNVTPNTETQ